MTGNIHMGNVILAGSGKRGILRPDADGYYKLNGGSFNRENRLGNTYDMNAYLLDCIDNHHSDLRRRIERGEVYAEMGHPVPYYLERVGGRIVRTMITDTMEWVQRLKTIDMDRACGHIRDFIFDMSQFDRRTMQGPVDFVVDIKPFGPFGEYFKDNLESPDMNTSLSIRTVTAPQQLGGKHRSVEHWSNVDWVPEPGFDKACKHKTDGLEHFVPDYNQLSDENGFVVNTDQAICTIEQALRDPNTIQTAAGMECYENVVAMLNDLKRMKTTMGNQKHTIIRSPLDLF